jgi:hypothetical protein
MTVLCELSVTWARLVLQSRETEPYRSQDLEALQLGRTHESCAGCSPGRGSTLTESRPCAFNRTPRHEGVLEEWRYSSMHSLTAAIDGGEWSASCSGCFIPGKEPCVTH